MIHVQTIHIAWRFSSLGIPESLFKSLVSSFENGNMEIPGFMIEKMSCDDIENMLDDAILRFKTERETFFSTAKKKEAEVYFITNYDKMQGYFAISKG